MGERQTAKYYDGASAVIEIRKAAGKYKRGMWSRGGLLKTGKMLWRMRRGKGVERGIGPALSGVLVRCLG